jgi:hypothetical protein
VTCRAAPRRNPFAAARMATTMMATSSRFMAHIVPDPGPRAPG